MRFLRFPWPARASAGLRQHGRWRTRASVCAAGFVGSFGLVIVAALILVHSLDRAPVKRWVQSLARTSAGLAIDYRKARIEWLSGAEIEDLVVQSPTEVRSFAPDLVRIGHLDVRWSWRSFLFRIGPIIRRLAVSDVTLTVVVDEQGRTSFDALSPSSPHGPPVPLSRQASTFLGSAPPVAQLDVDHVTLALLRTDHGAIFDRTELRGLSVTLATSLAEPAAKGWRADVGLGSPAMPLELRLARADAAGKEVAARAALWITVGATPAALTAAVDLRMIEQNLAASIAARHWLHIEASARFDPTAGRTEVKLDHAEAADGAATAEAFVEISDRGAVILRDARGDIDLARLLGWIPPGLVPVTAERARLRYKVDSVVAWPVAHLSEGGAVAVAADVSNVAVGAPFGPFQIGAGQLSVRAQPVGAGGVAVSGGLELTRTSLGSDEQRLAADDLTIDFDGTQQADGVLAGRVGARFARVERGGARSFVARDGHVELRVQGLTPDADEPLATRGDLVATLDLASLDLRFAGTRAILDGLAMRAHTALDGHAPYAVELEAPASRLRLIGRDGALLVDAPVRVEGRAQDVQPDIAHPAASRGGLHVAVEMGTIHASLDATKGAGAVDFALRAAAPSLKAVRPFLPPALAREAPWDRMAVSVRLGGRVDLLAGTPTVLQTTEVDVERPAFENAAARSLALTVQSHGTALQHQADVDLRVRDLAFDGGIARDEHVTLSATLDRERPALRFQVATEGRAAANLSGSLSFDRSRRSVPYEIDGHVARLAALAPFAAKVHGLDGFDLSQLEVGLSARGALLGVVAGVSPDGAITLEPSPARTAAVEGTTDVQIAHFRWSQGQTAIVTPALAWHGDMRSVGARRTLDSRVEVATLQLDLGRDDVELNGIRDESSVAVIGNLTGPQIELTQHLSVHAVEQSVVPEYPLGDLAFALSAERGPEGVVHVSDLRFANGLGGSALTVSGNVDLGEGRRTLSVTSSLTQELAPLSTLPEHFKGRGRVAMEANVTSPDLAHYTVRAAVKAQDVTATLPRAGVDVETANGEVPITAALEVSKNGLVLQRSEGRSPYSMLRFADQHPLLTRSGFLSIARLKTPFVEIAPLVGNLAIEQNVLSLRQFEIGVRGGTITGQCALAWDGPKSTLELHVRASGVQSSHGEPFDGNIAVVVSAADRTIDGRAEILRIGERHLLDLLDLQDPLHLDPAVNRIRTALAFGYPDSLHLVFDHGFASAHLQLGGLARFVSIGELRGIPMGPIVDKMLAPLLEGLDPKETP